jgi:RimJ/RimL family protein N-acetyltransferase
MGDVVESQRLRLRLPHLYDAPAAAAVLTDPEVMRLLGQEVVPPEHVVDVVQEMIDQWESVGLGAFMIERREDGQLLGWCGLLVFDTRTWTRSTFAGAGDYAQPELGWVLARAYWGQGYATEAAHAVRDWARDERGVDRLVSLIAPTNVASQRVAQRLGARPTETVRPTDNDETVVWVHPARRARATSLPDGFSLPLPRSC